MAAAATSAALHVLTSRELFRQITCWMPGWPLALDEFVAQRVARRGPSAARRARMLCALQGRTLPEAIVEELREHDEQPRAIQLLAMVYDLSRQSAVLRGKSKMSFERTLSHALRHGARAQVIRWLLDMQLHKRSSTQTQTLTQSETTSQTTSDGHDNDVAYCVSLWCDAIAGFRDDVGSLDVLREYIPVDVTASEERAQQVRSALGGRRDPALALLRWLRNEWPTLVIPHRVVDVAASQGQQDVVEWLCDDSASEPFTQAALQGALDAHQFATCVYLLRRCRDPEQTMLPHEDGSTSPMLDIAACEGDLDLVRALHELAPVVSCTTAAMDAAAANGDLKMVQYLHTKRREGCTTAAMDNAAANGHLDVVRFLHENRAEGCTAAAVDGAAGNGHREVVEFLLTNRHEGCTTDAMDRAVENDHLDIVEYLHVMRSEGCTSHAWAHVKSREMVAFLRQHKLQLLTTDGLANLLMCGMFDEWRDLRSHCKGDGVCGGDEGGDGGGGGCDGGDGAEQAMVRAGREFKASVIRFLAREMGRVDLEPWAMDGAVETQSVGWLHMIHEICGYGCNFTAVIKAIDADTKLPRRTPEPKLQESVACVLLVVSICMDATAANAMDYALSSRNSGLGSEIEMWSTSPDMRQFSTMIDPIYGQVEMPDWVLVELYHSRDRSWWRTDQRDPWSRLACKKGDLNALKLLHEAGHSPSYPADDEEFHFFPGSAHALAAEGGHLEMVQWLVQQFPSPVVPRMLEIAACHGHVDVARWLLSVLPENFTLEVQYEYIETKNVSLEAVQWIDTTPSMELLRNYARIAHDAAKHGRIDVLKYLFAKDPLCLLWVYSVGHAALTECQMEVLQYLRDEAHYDFSTIALETVYSIRAQREDVLTFFLAHKHEEIRNPNSFPSVLRGAAVRGLHKVTPLLLETARACGVTVDIENVLAATRRSQRSDRESMSLVMNQLGFLPFLQPTEVF